MESVWYLRVDGVAEGPFTLLKLKRDVRLTPDSWVWREGWKEWQQARNVEELKELFEEEEPETIKPQFKRVEDEEIALEMGQDPNPFLFVLLALILFYLVVRVLFFR
ncbi:MAG: DUF4339 domain-containing protein [Chlamydiia bacterium]|nr:DUF4339 domain-containing protein [Chlamydiia bacterium]